MMRGSGESAPGNLGGSVELERALAVLGPLEARIMRKVWTTEVAPPFTVHDVHQRMSELAYTTVLTTMRRLVDKALLDADAAVGRRSHHYRAPGDPAAFLAAQSDRETAAVLERYGDAALAAFAQRLEGLTPQQREALARLRCSR